LAAPGTGVRSAANGPLPACVQVLRSRLRIFLESPGRDLGSRASARLRPSLQRPRRPNGTPAWAVSGALRTAGHRGGCMLVDQERYLLHRDPEQWSGKIHSFLPSPRDSSLQRVAREPPELLTKTIARSSYLCRHAARGRARDKRAARFLDVDARALSGSGAPIPFLRTSSPRIRKSREQPRLILINSASPFPCEEAHRAWRIWKWT
jgi:hypothetical protein